MAADRGRTIAVMAHETGKTVREGDPEVSEAVDFARWAAASARTTLDELAADGVAADPLGVVLVAGPWNFPIAIPANGVVAALAAGNAVLLKPAPEAVATAVELVRHVHEAGVPADVVQLVRCPDDDVGRHLVTHPGVDAVVADRLLRDGPDVPRLAAVAAPARRDERQERAGHQPDRRRRPRPPRPRALGVRPRRAEVLGGEPGDRRGAAVRRRRRSCAGSPTPCAACGSGRRPTSRRWSARSSSPPPASSPAALTELDAGESWLVEPAPARRATGCGARACDRRAARVVVPPHRVLRAGARRDAGRRPRPRHRAPERRRVRADRRASTASTSRDRALARPGRGRQRLRQPAHDRRHRAPPAVRRLEAVVGRAGREDRRPRRHPPLHDVPPALARRPPARPTRRTATGGTSCSGVAIDRSGLRAEANVFRYRPVARVVVRVGPDTAGGRRVVRAGRGGGRRRGGRGVGPAGGGPTSTSSRTTVRCAAGSPPPAPNASACSRPPTTASRRLPRGRHRRSTRRR